MKYLIGMVSLPIIFVMFLVLIVAAIISDESLSSEFTISNFVKPFNENLDYTITSEFGNRIHPISGEVESFHGAVDIVFAPGSEILASYSGIVISSFFEANGGGNMVIIEHEVNGVKYQTAYAHMLDDSVVVSVGDVVTAKQKIGIIGNTGTSTGTHLHFALKIYDEKKEKFIPIDPIEIIESVENNMEEINEKLD